MNIPQKFDVTRNGPTITITLNPEAAIALADTLNDQATNFGLPPALFALGDRVNRLTQPEKWFGPGGFPPKTLPVKKAS